MKKRMLNFAMIATLALVMNTLAGCGNDEYIDAMSSDEINDYAESYGADVTVEEVVDADDPVVENKVIEDDTAEDDAVAEDESTAVETASPETDPVNTATPAPSASVEPTPTPAPVHTHNWKEHTATKEVWVPNIVVVDDYEEQVVGHVDPEFICNCGFTTNDRDTILEHIEKHIIAGENTQFTVCEGYDIVEQVKVGSHKEDHGHNETQTYVDYYYCDCGERK